MSVDWPSELRAAEARVCGPEDEVDLEANGDPSSLTGEEEGFDDMPLECGWQDEDDEEDVGDSDADDC